jgi:hypothetical protein
MLYCSKDCGSTFSQEGAMLMWRKEGGNLWSICLHLFKKCSSCGVMRVPGARAWGGSGFAKWKF